MQLAISRGNGLVQDRNDARPLSHLWLVGGDDDERDTMREQPQHERLARAISKGVVDNDSVDFVGRKKIKCDPICLFATYEWSF